MASGLRVSSWALACASVGLFASLDEALPGAVAGEARLVGLALGVLSASWSAPLALAEPEGIAAE